MDRLQPLWVRITLLALTSLGLACALTAGLTGLSRQKGQMRLLASLFVALAIGFAGVAETLSQDQIWSALVGVVWGSLLAWIGIRKYKRDPLGKTPANKML